MNNKYNNNIVLTTYIVRLCFILPCGLYNFFLYTDNLLTGLSLDYVHDALKIPYSYLLELPPSRRSPFGFALPAREIDSVSKEVFCSMQAALKRIDEDIAARQQAATTVPPTTTIQTTSTTAKTNFTTTTTSATPTTTKIQTKKSIQENSIKSTPSTKTPETIQKTSKTVSSTPVKTDKSGTLADTTRDNYRTSRRR